MEKQAHRSSESLGYVKPYDCGSFLVHMFDRNSFEDNITQAPLHSDSREATLIAQQYPELPVHGIRGVTLAVHTDTFKTEGTVRYIEPTKWKKEREKEKDPEPYKPSSHASFLRELLSKQPLTWRTNNVTIKRSDNIIHLQHTDSPPIKLSVDRDTSDGSMIVNLETLLSINLDEAYDQLTFTAYALGTIAGAIADIDKVSSLRKDPEKDLYIGIPNSISELSRTELAIESFVSQWAADQVPDISWGNDINSEEIAQFESNPEIVAEIVVSSVTKRDKRTIYQRDIVEAIRRVRELRHLSPGESTHHD